MFAYCLNNPSNYGDPSGQLCFALDSDNCLFGNMFRAGGNGLGGSYGGTRGTKLRANNALRKEIEHPSNTSEEDVRRSLESGGMAVYEGVPVFMTELPFDRSAFSFGVIVMDDYYKDVSDRVFQETLKHEYGHAVHLQQIGIPAYTTTVAIPSLIGAGLSYVSPYVQSNYFSLPWERTADYLGGVSRTYAPGANTLGSLFWLYTLIVSH